MTKCLLVLVSLLLCSALPGPADAASTATTDRALLSLFCAPKAIAGSTCKDARSYPAEQGRCDVTLQPGRQQGRFLAAGNPLLLVSYGSGCEPHVTNFGGVAVFEKAGRAYKFLGFQPGVDVSECVIGARVGAQDVLVCLTGWMGQGVIESSVARIVFDSGSDGSFNLSYDVLLQAEDTTSAYLTNFVRCSEQLKYFDLSKLAVGPSPGTVVAGVSYADRETIETACGKGFPKPNKDAEDMREPAAGEGSVPKDYAKTGSVVIDIASRAARLR
ncbi:exported hypothetical protein [Bradyrhizobium oligotrophicum S58]|uniref:Uncharacterized protein n=1 Tax=Bradyrhizobium oligotrophicum S58 TaxID=1245469 RepID=M4ZCW2_9BRAD|nr:hypothetical protein [Bradyrhizobium oligotrophicum]BAM91336.1 exported hypothetical protein [Bradyrhizobium oligotrophicum S58]